MSNRNKSRQPAANRGYSVKTVIFLFGCLVAYAMLQPVANRFFGWNLPGAWQIVERLQSPDTSTTRELGGGTVASRENGPASSSTVGEKSSSASTDSATNSSGEAASDVSTSGRSEPTESVDDYLKKLSRNRFQSPAGLLYGPGSEEGHRLKHVERHLADIPNRPGPHGVFSGTMVDFLKAIDQAYEMAKRREKGTSMKEDEGAVVYEATFGQSIGYLGGEAGKRQKNPKLKRMRLVVRNENEVITAFPIR